MGGKRWTASDIKSLTHAIADGFSSKDISLKLGRTQDSILLKAGLLGLIVQRLRKVSFCSIIGCDAPAKSLGLCSKHYQRNLKYGFVKPTVKRKDGDGYINKDGYVVKQVNGIRVMEHVLIAESVLGKTLPPGAVVHHVNGNRSDNSPSNLVICQDEAYHKILHMRTSAYKESGNANWRRCRRCRKHDDPKNMLSYVPKNRTTPEFYHSLCEKNHKLQVKNRRLARQKEGVA